MPTGVVEMEGRVDKKCNATKTKQIIRETTANHQEQVKVAPKLWRQSKKAGPKDSNHFARGIMFDAIQGQGSVTTKAAGVGPLQAFGRAPFVPERAPGSRHHFRRDKVMKAHKIVQESGGPGSRVERHNPRGDGKRRDPPP